MSLWLERHLLFLAHPLVREFRYGAKYRPREKVKKISMQKFYNYVHNRVHNDSFCNKYVTIPIFRVKQTYF